VRGWKNAGVPRRNWSLRHTLAALVAFAVLGVPAAAQTTLPACGAATLPTVASVDGAVALNIYHGELLGNEVVADIGHIVNSAPLLRAVGADNAAAAHTAVSTIVYTGRWHIVRLRVLDTAGRVLADVGGPAVIAPVTGALKVAGRVIGSYVMSVQDDVGFTKLELHAVGNPIAIYYNGARVAQEGGRLPASAPPGPTLMLHGVAYAVLTQTFRAFPSGTLTSVILVPPPNVTLATQPCIAVRAAEIGRVAEHLAARFHPLDASYANFAKTVRADTGATVILRIGARPIAGSQGIGPPVIPDSGVVAYEGHSWWVFSFAPTPPARIYLLISAPAIPATG